MNREALAHVLRDYAKAISDEEEPKVMGLLNQADVAELIRVLARLVEGKPLGLAFGAPGDWGYGTPIGDTLAAKPEPSELLPIMLQYLRKAHDHADEALSCAHHLGQRQTDLCYPVEKFTRDSLSAIEKLYPPAPAKGDAR